MPATANAVPERLQRASRTRGFDGIRAKCLGNSILQLLQRTAEDFASLRAQGPLPLRFELRSESQEPKAVVAGDVESQGQGPLSA